MGIQIDLSNHRAIVTGASSGIGTGIAVALAQAGCAVAGCGIEAADSAGAQAFVSGVQAHGHSAFYQTVDLTDGTATRAFVEWAALQLGGIDFVVSNAGANFNIGAENTSEAQWHANFELNLAAHWRVAQTAKPYLDAAKNPVVLLVASTQSFRTVPNSFPYNVAKAGVLGMVQSLALEWGPHARTVGVAPGFVDTPMNIEWFGRAADPAALRAKVEGIHPLKRIGTAEDIGALCAFLCSPLASFITGTTIVIDGGRSASLQDL